MSAAERKVRERYPHDARCERSVLEYALGKPFTVRVLIDGSWVAIGGGVTQLQAWRDAASRLASTAPTTMVQQ